MNRATGALRLCGVWLAASLAAPSLGVALVLITSSGVVEAQFNTAPGIWGSLKDPDGKPLVGIPIWIELNRPNSLKLTLKTDKNGSFSFPNVEFDDAGYKFGVDAPELYISKFHVQTRRGTGELYQDDQLELKPTQQAAFPIVRFRIGHAQIDLVMSKIADYKGPLNPVASGATTEAAKAELTPEQQADDAAALGDYATAATKLEQALAAKPGDPNLMWKQVQYLAKGGRGNDALKVARKLAAIDPKRPGVHLFIARALLDEGATEGVVPQLELEKQLDPENPKLYAAMVPALQSAGAAEAAILAAAEKWVALAASDPEALITLGSIKAKKGDLAGSQEIFAKVAALDPSNAPSMFYNVGVLILRRESLSSEDRERAATAFRKAIELNPKYASAHLQLGYTLAALGKMAEAKKELQQFLELDPSNADAADVREMIKGM